MISIIIPCYNQQEFVASAIDSALDQTIPCEVIVVDDGSTDKSGEIIDSYKDKVRVIHQVNKGLSSARNTGLMNATGSIIIPLDADDLLMSQCAEWAQNMTTDILMWNFKEFGVRNAEVRLQTPTLEDMKTANRLAYCSAYKREKALEIGGYSPRMVFGYEDLHFWIDLLKRGATISHIPEVLFLYRTKEQSMLTDSIKHHEELMAQIHKDHKEIFA